MKIGEGVEWGIHCALVLASLPADAVMPSKALAEFHGVSESYLLKQLKLLTKANLLTATSGPAGGYRLARPPAGISLLDITTAIDGNSPAFRCTEIRQASPVAGPPSSYTQPCAIHAAMQQAERAWRRELAAISLADLLARMKRHGNTSQLANAQTWLEGRARLTQITRKAGA